MGVYIENMEKPKSCAKCKLVTQFVMGELFCDVLDKQVSPYVIPHDCPLIEIGDIQYKAFLEFNEKLMKKLEEHILYGERRNR